MGAFGPTGQSTTGFKVGAIPRASMNRIGKTTFLSGIRTIHYRRYRVWATLWGLWHAQAVSPALRCPPDIFGMFSGGLLWITRPKMPISTRFSALWGHCRPHRQRGRTCLELAVLVILPYLATTAAGPTLADQSHPTHIRHDGQARKQWKAKSRRPVHEHRLANQVVPGHRAQMVQ